MPLRYVIDIFIAIEYFFIAYFRHCFRLRWDTPLYLLPFIDAIYLMAGMCLFEITDIWHCHRSHICLIILFEDILVFSGITDTYAE